jgi:hypothetical protein
LNRRRIKGQRDKRTKGQRKQVDDVQIEKDQTPERVEKSRFRRTVDWTGRSRTCNHGIESLYVEKSSGCQVRSGEVWKHGDPAENDVDGDRKVDGELGKKV